MKSQESLMSEINRMDDMEVASSMDGYIEIRTTDIDDERVDDILSNSNFGICGVDLQKNILRVYRQ